MYQYVQLLDVGLGTHPRDSLVADDGVKKLTNQTSCHEVYSPCIVSEAQFIVIVMQFVTKHTSVIAQSDL